MVRSEKEIEVIQQAEILAQEKILDMLFPVDRKTERKKSPEAEQRYQRNRQRLKKKLEKGDFEDKVVELDISSDFATQMQVFGPFGMEEIGTNLKDMLSNIMPGQKKRRKMSVKAARKILTDAEAHNLIDQDEVIRLAKESVENNGIVFLDEIDKIAGSNKGVGPDVSREGVQRDLLPIIEGSSVPTKYGIVKTDHILFIAAGAFHISTPSDMIPELQGRFPIRVEMNKLSTNDFIKILTHPKSALIKQYQALLEAESVDLKFEKPAIHAIAQIATEVNNKTENIGARRLHTIMTTLLDDHLYEQTGRKKQNIVITKNIVVEKLAGIASDQDLSRYIL
jgi:ATP-dependent HslUV protease ATP-binding subunit HslU